MVHAVKVTSPPSPPSPVWWPTVMKTWRKKHDFREIANTISAITRPNASNSDRIYHLTFAFIVAQSEVVHAWWWRRWDQRDANNIILGHQDSTPHTMHSFLVLSLLQSPPPFQYSISSLSASYPSSLSIITFSLVLLNAKVLRLFSFHFLHPIHHLPSCLSFRVSVTVFIALLLCFEGRRWSFLFVSLHSSMEACSNMNECFLREWLLV